MLVEKIVLEFAFAKAEFDKRLARLKLCSILADVRRTTDLMNKQSLVELDLSRF
ncbi:hypothetical protein [Nonlabens marinus]|uniref:Uncharacterized protein n=1 Tax=Nonlabens marinus S1-08 TaxID=1454201 RepID=W8VXB8_9FLAO|nr:hypothetical protein [Nonlabens marinus]BAO55652.1 hypothetical protein NMS_1643 [Nonlabens marinus S1-08]